MDNIDLKNSIFWDEMCGSTLAQELGIMDSSKASLDIYDNYYLNYYPYLLKRVPVHGFANEDVLEVGLGYGTLSRVLIKNSKSYKGLDIAQGPVDLVNLHLSENSNSFATRGSMKECPFDDESFDSVVSIGCFHHTGDLAKCISETHRVLKKNGSCYLMVYNKFSYRQWFRWPLKTTKNMLWGKNSEGSISKGQREAYDTNTRGEEAPETQFFSIDELKEIMSPYFKNISFHKENTEDLRAPFGIRLLKRHQTLKTLGHVAGLDIYFSGEKK